MSGDAFKRTVALTTLNNMMRKSFFSICAVRDAAELLGARTDGEAFRVLHALHCTDWGLMPAEVRNAVPGLIQEALGDVAPRFYDVAPPVLLTIDVHAVTAPKKTLLQRLGIKP